MAYEHKQPLEDIKHDLYESSIVSDYEVEEEDKQQWQSPKGPAPLFMPISNGSNLCATATKEENIHDLVLPVIDPPTQLPTNVIPTEQEEDILFTKSPQAYLLQQHYRLGNCSFTLIRLLATLGILPRKFFMVKPLHWDGYLYGAMANPPWRTFPASNRGNIPKASAPGEFVSVDQI